MASEAPGLPIWSSFPFSFLFFVLGCITRNPKPQPQYRLDWNSRQCLLFWQPRDQFHVRNCIFITPPVYLRILVPLSQCVTAFVVKIGLVKMRLIKKKLSKAFIWIKELEAPWIMRISLILVSWFLKSSDDSKIKCAAAMDTIDMACRKGCPEFAN